jgi:hypothetical protein
MVGTTTTFPKNGDSTEDTLQKKLLCNRKQTPLKNMADYKKKVLK